MSFWTALAHAYIGYGIRRKVWGPNAILNTDNRQELWWLPGKGEESRAAEIGGEGGLGVSLEDMKATDWETV